MSDLQEKMWLQMLRNRLQYYITGTMVDTVDVYQSPAFTVTSGTNIVDFAYLYPSVAITYKCKQCGINIVFAKDEICSNCQKEDILY